MKTKSLSEYVNINSPTLICNTCGCAIDRNVDPYCQYTLFNYGKCTKCPCLDELVYTVKPMGTYGNNRVKAMQDPVPLEVSSALLDAATPFEAEIE